MLLLEPYTDGELSFLLNATENVDIVHDRLIAFDMEDASKKMCIRDSIKDSRVDYQRNLSTLSKAYHHPCDAFCEEVLELSLIHILSDDGYTQT